MMCIYMKSIYLYVAQILMFLQSSIWEGSQECYYSSDMRCRAEIGRSISTFVENKVWVISLEGSGA